MTLPLSTPGRCCGHNLNWHNGVEGICTLCACVGFEPELETQMARCADCKHHVDDHEWSGCAYSPALGLFDCDCPNTPSVFSNQNVRVLCSAQLRSDDPKAENWVCELGYGHLKQGVDHKSGDLHWTDSIAIYPATKLRPAVSSASGPEVANPERTTVGNGAARLGQVGGDHYSKHKIQPWDIWEAYGLNAFEGSIIKYLLRYKDKNGVEDLKKARHTLDKLIEVEEARSGG